VGANLFIRWVFFSSIFLIIIIIILNKGFGGIFL
jgi:hypothetical protein